MKQAEWKNEETTPPTSWPQNGEIKFEELALRYREGLDLVLKGISVNIAAGEKVNILEIHIANTVLRMTHTSCALSISY